MGLAERLAAGAPKRISRVEYSISQLLPDEKAALLAAALDPEWSDVALAGALQDEGLIVGVDTLSAWRAATRVAGQIPEPLPLPVVEPVVEPPVVEPPL